MKLLRINASVYLVALALILLLPSQAHAGTAYHGSDYSTTSSVNNRWIMVCDKERDGIEASVQYRTYGGGWGWMRDDNGASSGCASTTTGANITAHKTCEHDSCSDWSFH